MTLLLALEHVAQADRAVKLLMSHRLFLEPLALDRYWLVLLVPLVAVICVVYKTIKLEDIAQLPRWAGLLAGQIIFFMALAAVVLWVITWLM